MAQTPFPSTLSPVVAETPPLSAREFFVRHRSPVWLRTLAALLDSTMVVTVGAFIAMAIGEESVDPVFGPVIVALVATFVYHAALEISPWGATLGKRVVGLATIRCDGQALTAADVLLRGAARLLGWVFIGVPNLVCLMLPQRAMLHDLITRTRTVQTRSEFWEEDLQQLRQRSATSWSVPVKMLAGAGYALLALSLLLLGMLVRQASDIRASFTSGYEDLRPAMRAIEDFHRQHGRFPASLEEAGRPVKLRDNSPVEASYVADKGVLLLRMGPRQVPVGAMALGLVAGLEPGDAKALSWVCTGSQGFLLSYIPRGCKTPGGIAFDRLHQRAQNR